MNIEHRTSNIECWMGEDEESDIWFRRKAARVFGVQAIRPARNALKPGWVRFNHMIYISMFTPTQWIIRGRRAFIFQNNPVRHAWTGELMPKWKESSSLAPKLVVVKPPWAWDWWQPWSNGVWKLHRLKWALTSLIPVTTAGLPVLAAEI